MFTVTTIRLLYSMLAVSMLGLVVGHDSDSFWEKTETESYIDERDDYDPPLPWCGRLQDGLIGPGRKRRSNNGDDSDDLDKFGVSRYAVLGEIPWQVNLRFNKKLTKRCGGAIINEYWVLTAASCVRCKRRRNIDLVVGDYSLSAVDPGEQTFKVSGIYIHGFYDADFGDYNIALLKIKRTNNHGILFNKYVQPICLPVAGEYPLDGLWMTIAGWNDYWRPGQHDMMRLGRVPAIGLQECRQQNVGSPWLNITDRVICAGEGTFNVRVTENVYGGSVTRHSGQFQFFLAGIVSHRSSCQESCRVYTYVTSVVSYLQWIYNTINSNSDNDEKIIRPRPSRYFTRHRHRSELGANDTYYTYPSY